MKFLRDIPPDVWKLGKIIGLISGFIVAVMVVAVMSAQQYLSDQPRVSAAAVQALCIHLNEKWRAEGKDWYIPMKDCKARKPLKSSTPGSEN